MLSETALTKSGITKGSEVEVCSDEEGFKGAWYRAILEETPSKSRRKKLRIRYMTLLKDDYCSLLSETVDPSFVRPPPPEAVAVDGEVFEEGDVVDAGYRDGWWAGVVRKVLEDGRYVVYFDKPPDVIEFESKDLRKHFDWIDGNWVQAERQQLKNSTFSSGTSVELRPETEDLCDVWAPGVVVKENEDGTLHVKYKSSKVGDDVESKRVDVDPRDIRPSPLPCKDRVYSLMEQVDVRHESGWREGVVTRILSGKMYTVLFKRTEERIDFSELDLRPSVEWRNGMWQIETKPGTPPQVHPKQSEHNKNNADNSEEAVGSEKSLCGTQNKTEERPPSKRLRVKLGDRSTSVSESYAVSSAKKVKITRSSVGANQSTFFTASNGGYAAGDQASVFTTRTTNMQNTTPTVQANHAFSTPRAKSMRWATRLAADGNTSIDSQTSIPKVADSEKQQVCGETNGKVADAVTDEDSLVNGKPAAAAAAAAPKVFDSPIVQGIKATSAEETEAKAQGKTSPKKTLQTRQDQKGSANDSAGEKETEEQKNSNIGYKRKKGQPRKFIRQEFCQAVPNASDQNAGGASGDPEAATKGSCNVSDDDQPLSTWIGANSSSAAVELSLSSTRTPEAVNGSPGEKQLGVVVETPGKDTTVALPFVKKSPLWDTIESMEVFKAVPQRPHFSPLLETKEVFREGSAVGIMVTFAVLLERVKDLLLDDPRSTLESVKEGLFDVEKHGFDVTAPLSRVNELLSLKDKQMQSLNERENLYKEVEECHGRSVKYEKDLEGIRVKISELECQLAKVTRLKESTDAEKARLVSRAAALDKDIQNVEHEFHKIVTAPWKLPETPL